VSRRLRGERPRREQRKRPCPPYVDRTIRRLACCPRRVGLTFTGQVNPTALALGPVTPTDIGRAFRRAEAI
jgi:hypothetical protein